MHCLKILPSNRFKRKPIHRSIKNQNDLDKFPEDKKLELEREKEELVLFFKFIPYRNSSRFDFILLSKYHKYELRI